MRKFFAALLIVFVMGSGINTSAVFAAAKPPAIQGASCIVMDMATGKILYEKNKDEMRFPASTTKMITALLALENLKLDTVVTIDGETPFAEGSKMFLLEGEQVTVEQLLFGMMVESCNDAAEALGKEISGTVPEFAKLMNQRAKELGAKNTNFVNPNGLHDDAHKSTAYDLAMVARYAMKNPMFRELVTTYRYVLPKTNKQDTRYLYNTNRLLYDDKTKVTVNGTVRTCKYEGITGIKTGYTSRAGGCLAASAKRGDTEILSVVMGSTDLGRFSDSILLLDYGFANYKTVPVMEKGKALGTVKVKRGAVNKIDVMLGDVAMATLPIEASAGVISTKLKLFDKLKAPVKSGEKAGVLSVYEGEELVSEVAVVTVGPVKKGGPLSILGITDRQAKIIVCVALGFLILLIGLLVFYTIMKRRQIKMRKLRRQQRRVALEQKELARRHAWEQEYENRRLR